MAALLKRVIGEHALLAAENDVALADDIAPEAQPIRADEEKIIQVASNLLSNAIKYTGKGGRAAVSLRRQGEDLRVEVADTGPGIAPEDTAKVFDKYERLTKEKREGTGLGLPIAKEIVELHKGKMWLESEVGKGSRFIFILPRGLAYPDAGAGFAQSRRPDASGVI